MPAREAIRSGPMVWPVRSDIPFVAMKTPRFSFGAWEFRREKTFGRLMPWAIPKRTVGTRSRGRSPETPASH